LIYVKENCFEFMWLRLFLYYLVSCLVYLIIVCISTHSVSSLLVEFRGNLMCGDDQVSQVFLCDCSMCKVSMLNGLSLLIHTLRKDYKLHSSWISVMMSSIYTPSQVFLLYSKRSVVTRPLNSLTI
jgi:hypothetical protein